MTAPFLFVAAAALLRHSLQLVQISGVFVVAVKDDDFADAQELEREQVSAPLMFVAAATQQRD